MEQKYSAASLCSITTEVLKVLNATEELIEGAVGEASAPPEPTHASHLPSSSKKLDEHLTKLEENVRQRPSYCSAGAALRRGSHAAALCSIRSVGEILKSYMRGVNQNPQLAVLKRRKPPPLPGSRVGMCVWQISSANYPGEKKPGLVL